VRLPIDERETHTYAGNNIDNIIIIDSGGIII